MLFHGVRTLAWPTLAVGSAVVAYWCWQLPANDLRLGVSDAARDQVHITWNRDAAPVLLARAGALEILDGGIYREALLTPNQLRAGGITYRRESGTVEVRLRLESRWRNSALAWFHGAEPPGPPTGAALVEASIAGSVSGRSAPPALSPLQGEADRATPPPRRAAVIPDYVPEQLEATTSVTLPPPPVEPVGMPVALGSLSIPVPVPRPPAYSGPRSGRIIWTGSMGRRGVVEIEGSHTSIGSLKGSFPGLPVTVQVSPADFSPGKLVVHSAEASSNNRRENPSAANGWNATLFQWEPERADKLVVLESPNPSNDFKRLVVRNDARTCSVIVVDWNVR